MGCSASVAVQVEDAERTLTPTKPPLPTDNKVLQHQQQQRRSVEDSGIDSLGGSVGGLAGAADSRYVLVLPPCCVRRCAHVAERAGETEPKGKGNPSTPLHTTRRTRV